MSCLKSMSVGFHQWQAEPLLTHFYPEDLPLDWRADYYFNYFRVAMTSQSDWMQWDQDSLNMLNEAMLAENLFYLHWSECSAQSVTQFRCLRTNLGAKLAGVLISDGWCAEDLALHQADLEGIDVTLMAPMEDDWVLSGWQWRYNNLSFSGSPLAYFDALPESIKAQRVEIDAFKTSLPGSTAVPVFVNPHQVTTKQLTDLSSMIELLGY